LNGTGAARPAGVGPTEASSPCSAAKTCGLAVRYSFLSRKFLAGKRPYLEAGPSARGIGAEGVFDLQFRQDSFFPLDRPFERLRLAFPTMPVEIVGCGCLRVLDERDLGGRVTWMQNRATG